MKTTVLIEYEETSEWQNGIEEKVRYRKLAHQNIDRSNVNDYEFQILKKPYFFGLVGKHRWETSVITNNVKIGYDYSCSQVKKKHGFANSK